LTDAGYNPPLLVGYKLQLECTSGSLPHFSDMQNELSYTTG
jgi:hypothetical protein